MDEFDTFAKCLFIDLALSGIELFNYLQVAVLVKFCCIADLKSLMIWDEDQASGLLIKSFKSFLFKMNKTLHLFLNRPNVDSAKLEPGRLPKSSIAI